MSPCVLKVQVRGEFVIASEAKQSRLRRAYLDCFAAFGGSQ
jgi:hypothetical protein